MGSGSAALLWYACCCSFVAFVGILGAGLSVFGRKRDAKRRLAATGGVVPGVAPSEVAPSGDAPASAALPALDARDDDSSSR